MKSAVELYKVILFLSLTLSLPASNFDTVKKIDFHCDNMPLVNGKRTFIIGSYHLPKPSDPFDLHIYKIN